MQIFRKSNEFEISFVHSLNEIINTLHMYRISILPKININKSNGFL